MKKTTDADAEAPLFVGIDVSKQTFDAFWTVPGGDPIHRKYHNDPDGFRQLMEHAPSGAAFVMEGTGFYHHKLAHTLHAEGRTAHVCNPRMVSSYARSLGARAKTDKADAKMLADYALSRQGGKQPLRPWQPAAPGMEEARPLRAVCAQLRKQITQTKNLLKALDAAESVAPAVDAARNALAVLEEQHCAAEKRLLDIVQAALPETMRLVSSIPSIGKRSAAAILTATGDPARFKTADSLVAYLGLNPNTRESGTSVRGKTRITKAGNSYARGVLFGCAVVAMRRHYKSGKALNPPCCALWERMVARNKGGRCGCVAVAAKLARTIWGVCKRGEPWSRENAR